MNKTLVVLLFIVTSLFVQLEPSSAQRATPPIPLPKVVLRSLGSARVSLSRGTLHATIDLSEEVVGCGYVSGEGRIALRKRGCAASPATFKLIDATTQNGSTYVVVLSDAAGNCNVCGRCGATEAFVLIWLELDASLRLRQKKSVTLEDCMAFISMVSPAGEVNETPNDSGLALSFKDDVLSVEFEKRIFDDNDNDKTSYQLSHLKYSRREPGLGFSITTETRTQSANGN